MLSSTYNRGPDLLSGACHPAWCVLFVLLSILLLYGMVVEKQQQMDGPWRFVKV